MTKIKLLCSLTASKYTEWSGTMVFYLLVFKVFNFFAPDGYVHVMIYMNTENLNGYCF